MANFKGGKRKQSEGAKAKFWSLQVPGSEASVSEAAPGVPEPDSRAISQKALMLFTAPHRLPSAGSSSWRGNIWLCLPGYVATDACGSEDHVSWLFP